MLHHADVLRKYNTFIISVCGSNGLVPFIWRCDRTLIVLCWGTVYDAASRCLTRELCLRTTSTVSAALTSPIPPSSEPTLSPTSHVFCRMLLFLSASSQWELLHSQVWRNNRLMHVNKQLLLQHSSSPAVKLILKPSIWPSELKVFMLINTHVITVKHDFWWWKHLIITQTKCGESVTSIQGGRCKPNGQSNETIIQCVKVFSTSPLWPRSGSFRPEVVLGISCQFDWWGHKLKFDRSSFSF